jgi:two-component sensor histidine kinase
MSHSLLEHLLSQDYMPHGMCYLWEPALLWLHVVSDGLIALAYYSIPLLLAYFVWRRRDVVFPSVFIVFALFILSCGTTHLLAVWTVWHPDYWLDGGVKALTAIASLSAVAMLARVIPDALALPSPEQLRRANAALAAEIHVRRQAEAEVRRLNEGLEGRVAERAAELILANQGLEQVNHELTEALRHKEVLVREVHHRVKNNLQVVSSLMSLRASRLPPEQREVFVDIGRRIAAIGRVHEQLHHTEDPDSFDLGQYLETLRRDLPHMFAAADRIDVRVESVPFRVPLSDATPLLLIITEILSNAYRHAFPDGRKGRVLVRLERTAAGARLTISDDGVGISTTDEPTGTMGLSLINGLVRQVEGAYVIDRNADGGTAFTLDLPLLIKEQPAPDEV